MAVNLTKPFRGREYTPVHLMDEEESIQRSSLTTTAAPNKLPSYTPEHIAYEPDAPEQSADIDVSVVHAENAPAVVEKPDLNVYMNELLEGIENADADTREKFMNEFLKAAKMKKKSIKKHGRVLTNRFKSCMDWEYLLEDGKAAKKYMGTVLSGEKLLDDKNYRDKLHSSFPEAIGGEMEGAGLASVAMANNLYEWIIVKGICDWGYDKQSENKDRYQKIAMESAISLCESVLCDDSVLEEILKAENRKKNADNLMLRINAYKLFFYRNSQKITIKELSKLSGISIGHISKCEKINAEENEFSIRIFRETTVATIRSLEKALNLRKGELTADDDDLLAEKYKNYYLKRKGIHATPMKLKNAKIVVFDYDGTLVSPNFSKTTWERIWTELGYSVNDCDYYHRQFSNKQITHEQWCKITEDKFREAGLTKDIMKKIASEMVLIDGCKETLMELKSRDVLLYIVSGSIREIIKEVLGDMVNLFEDISANKFYFQKGKLSRIVGTEYDFEGKAEYIKQIVNENKINASEVLFVGNSFNDTFVHLSGARTLCINPQNTNYTNSIYWHDYIREVNNLREIIPHVFIEDK